MTIQEAKETRIFYFNQDGEIEEGSLYDFVMESVDETTSPRGVEPRIHIRHRKEEIIIEEGYLDGEIIPEAWEIWSWGVQGSNPHKLEECETEEKALQNVFDKVFTYDFIPDDQRDTFYSENREDLEKIKKEREQ